LRALICCCICCGICWPGICWPGICAICAIRAICGICERETRPRLAALKWALKLGLG
jgi:hypothetical protein